MSKQPFGSPIGKPALPLSIAPCARCGQSCMIRPQEHTIESGQVDLRAATTTHGMCRECATHWYLWSIDGLRWAWSETSDAPAALAQPNVQTALSRVLGMMHPELAGCDWARMAQQWQLPWPDDWRLPE